MYKCVLKIVLNKPYMMAIKFQSATTIVFLPEYEWYCLSYDCEDMKKLPNAYRGKTKSLFVHSAQNNRCSDQIKFNYKKIHI